MSSREVMLVFRPEGDPVSQRECELCMRQFDSMSNILDMLADAGRTAKWVEETHKRGGVM